MKLTRNLIVLYDELSYYDGTKWVEVPPNPEVLVLPSLTRGGQVSHHNFLLLPRSQEEIAHLRFLRGRLVEVADLIHGEVILEQLPP